MPTVFSRCVDPSPPRVISKHQRKGENYAQILEGETHTTTENYAPSSADSVWRGQLFRNSFWRLRHHASPRRRTIVLTALLVSVRASSDRQRRHSLHWSRFKLGGWVARPPRQVCCSWLRRPTAVRRAPQSCSPTPYRPRGAATSACAMMHCGRAEGEPTFSCSFCLARPDGLQLFTFVLLVLMVPTPPIAECVVDSKFGEERRKVVVSLLIEDGPVRDEPMLLQELGQRRIRTSRPSRGILKQLEIRCRDTLSPYEKLMYGPQWTV